MLNETPRFIHGVAGAHPWPQDTEVPTWNAYLIIVFTRELGPDQAPSGQEKG